MPYYIQDGVHLHYDTRGVSKTKKTAFVQDVRNKVTIGRRCSIVDAGIKRVYEIVLTVLEYKEYRLIGKLPTRLKTEELRFLKHNLTPSENKGKPKEPTMVIRDSSIITSKAELITWRYGSTHKEVTIVKEAYSKLVSAYILINALKEHNVIETDKGIVLSNYNADVYKICLELL